MTACATCYPQLKGKKVIHGCCCLLATSPNATQDLGYLIKPKRRPGLVTQGHPHSVLLQLVLVSRGILATGGDCWETR